MTPEEFKKIRTDLGYSQAKMATTLGRALVTIQHWEQGINPIDFVKGEGIKVIIQNLKEKT